MAKKKKKVVALVKLKCPGGQATPAPPVGPALGQHGLNPGEFVKRFNDMTRDQMGIPISMILHVYEDRKFDIELKGSPTSFLLKQAAGVAKGSGVPNREKVGKVTTAQVREIAEQKTKYMNSHTIEQAMLVVAGTARSMGITVVDE
jgi:large subunit ribosomal protein L11